MRVASNCGGCNALQHPIVPSFGSVLGACDVARFDFGVFAQHGIQQVVDRHIVYFLQIALKAFAITAIGIGKDHQFSFAVAFNLRESKFNRQAVKGNGRKFVVSLFR